ncbi:hypothetical protein F7725_010661 [Dissostichus mawsoni]|uniref:IkappaB kinase complex-associated protein n=1 Tax=Dissostichus mawsoni TaxID=36200 RepID=A0A7J5XPY3_DISMA|nr:hypothetical protein F7725_010661 [Dissostichus mawsoni]
MSPPRHQGAPPPLPQRDVAVEGEMRNLKLLKSLQSSELQILGSPLCLSVRSDTGSLLDGSGGVVGLQDLAELESACLATAGGDVGSSSPWVGGRRRLSSTALRGKRRRRRRSRRFSRLQIGTTGVLGSRGEETVSCSLSVPCANRAETERSESGTERESCRPRARPSMGWSAALLEVKDLLWNSDSSVLAVWLEDMTAGEDGQINTCIQLWTVGNYHWYLKQSLDFGRDALRAPRCVCWDPERPLRLHMLTHSWTSVTYDWSFTTDKSSGSEGSDNANVAVIDGDKILVTNFRQCVVPPPMCSFELQLSSPVNQVTFLCQPQRTNQLAALTSDGQISLYVQDLGNDLDQSADGFRRMSRPLVLQKTFRAALWLCSWRTDRSGSSSTTALCSISGEEHLLGLTDRSHLYVGDTENDETLRRVERGSRIVTVVPHDTRVILQMPRGNLETKLRINMNLIYDHNPKVFLENIQTFITQLNSISHINLFLTELKEEDTTSSMYPRPPDISPAPQPVSLQKKVDVVLPLHPDDSREEERPGAGGRSAEMNPPADPGSVSAEEALKYLLFLVNVNDLYEHSLGTYDFDLVLMVAEKSQKDPKEYLPFLNMLKSAEHFPEALQLVKEQKLYSEALRLYSADPPHYKNQQMEQAGLLLWRCGEPAAALQAFASASCWRNAVCAAQQIPLPPDQIALLARDLAEKLIEQRRHSEAALLLDQYAKDCEEAILALITGSVWDEALRLIYMHNRQDITETNLKPALLEAFSTQIGFLEVQVATRSSKNRRKAERKKLSLKEGARWRTER